MSGEVRNDVGRIPKVRGITPMSVMLPTLYRAGNNFNVNHKFKLLLCKNKNVLEKRVHSDLRFRENKYFCQGNN